MANETLQNLALMQGMIGGIQRGEAMQAQQRVHDMQAQKLAEDRASDQAAPDLYRQMQEDPQFMDKFQPKDANDLAAFTKARGQFLASQEGRIKAFENATRIGQQTYKMVAAPLREAMDADAKGDTQLAADRIITASHFFPDQMRVTGYDPNTGEFAISKPNPQTGGYDAIGTKSYEEVMQMGKTMLSGGRVRQDGVEINPEFAKLFAMNAFAAQDENHQLANAFATGKIKAVLQDGKGNVIQAVPQYDFVRNDYNYFIPGQGFASKEQLSKAGYRFTTEDMVKQAETERHNRVAEGLTASGQQLQRDSLEFNKTLRGDALRDNRVDMLNKQGDDLLREEDAIYKRYSQVPVNPDDPMGSLLAQKQDGMQNLMKAANAGDQQAISDLQRARDLRSANERIGKVRMGELESRFPELRGMNAPEDVGTPAQPTQSAPSKTDRALEPAANNGQRGAEGDTPPVKGARRAKDGNWYVMKDGKWNKIEQ